MSEYFRVVQLSIYYYYLEWGCEVIRLDTTYSTYMYVVLVVHNYRLYQGC